MSTVLDHEPARVERLPAERLDHVVDTLIGELRKDYAPPNMKRHAHPKMHGCVLAVLTVENQAWLEKHGLCHGIFSEPGHEYRAFVRFSNALGVDHDMKFNSRGMAIKVLGVEGERLFENEEPFSFEDDTQDFVLAVHDAFVLPNTTDFDYAEFAKAARSGIGSLIGLFVKHRLWRGLAALFRGGSATARNPLAIRYFTQTAYMFGPHKVKIQARPVFTHDLRRSLPNVVWFFLKMVAANIILGMAKSKYILGLLKFIGLAGTPEAAELFVDRHIAPRHTLRYAMSAFLASHPAEFEILVQRQTDPDRMPDNDPTVRWKESLSQYERVATLTIPRQVFWPATGMPEKILRGTIDLVDLGEDISYSPWHGLTAHEPLGDINCARGRIYKDIAAFRHQQNGVVSRPNGGQSAYLRNEYLRLRDIVQDGLMEP